MLKKINSILNVFKNRLKKNDEAPIRSEDLNIILCIPGLWKDRSEILVNIVATNKDEYIFAGRILLHLPTNTHFEIEIYEPDTGLRKSFEVAGQGRISETDLSVIDKHTFVIYLIGKGGSQTSADKIMHAGYALLKAGGLAIKTETSGKAFSKTNWKKLVEDKSAAKFVEAFVVFVINSDNSIYSCGMHNIGLRDICCGNDLDINEATDLIRIFIYYLLIDNPTIKSGQTFSQQADTPIFIIIEDKCKTYSEGNLFFNPYGMYHMKSK